MRKGAYNISRRLCCSPSASSYTPPTISGEPTDALVRAHRRERLAAFLAAREKDKADRILAHQKFVVNELRIEGIARAMIAERSRAAKIVKRMLAEIKDELASDRETMIVKHDPLALNAKTWSGLTAGPACVFCDVRISEGHRYYEAAGDAGAIHYSCKGIEERAGALGVVAIDHRPACVVETKCDPVPVAKVEMEDDLEGQQYMWA